jgi:hypothetical protein
MFIDYQTKIRLAPFRQIHQHPTLSPGISIFQAKFGFSEFALFLRKFDEISSILYPSIPVTFTVTLVEICLSGKESGCGIPNDSERFGKKTLKMLAQLCAMGIQASTKVARQVSRQLCYLTT